MIAPSRLVYERECWAKKLQLSTVASMSWVVGALGALARPDRQRPGTLDEPLEARSQPLLASADHSQRKGHARLLTAVAKSPPRLSGATVCSHEVSGNTSEETLMVITDETIQVDRTPSNTPPRRPIRRLLGIGTAIVVAAVALVAVAENSGPTRSDQTPEPARHTDDEIVRDLVARGVVPAATLDDGTQIISPALAP